MRPEESPEEKISMIGAYLEKIWVRKVPRIGNFGILSRNGVFFGKKKAKIIKNYIFLKSSYIFKTERRIHEFCVSDLKNGKIGPIGPKYYSRVATANEGVIYKSSEILLTTLS